MHVHWELPRQGWEGEGSSGLLALIGGGGPVLACGTLPGVVRGSVRVFVGVEGWRGGGGDRRGVVGTLGRGGGG